MAIINRFMLAFFGYSNDVEKKKTICQHETMVSVSKKISEFIALCEENNLSRLLLLSWNPVAKKEILFFSIFLTHTDNILPFSHQVSVCFKIAHNISQKTMLFICIVRT